VQKSFLWKRALLYPRVFINADPLWKNAEDVGCKERVMVPLASPIVSRWLKTPEHWNHIENAAPVMRGIGTPSEAWRQAMELAQMLINNTAIARSKKSSNA